MMGFRSYDQLMAWKGGCDIESHKEKIALSKQSPSCEL